MIELDELIRYCDRLLDPGAFQDYCPNGLQVQGRARVRRLVAGVTASQALIEAAAEARADALLVHHGFFWKGESPVVTGRRRRRLARLLEADISLIAYHLPLDAHPRLGNNARLGELLGFEPEGTFGAPGMPELAWRGRLPGPMAPPALAERIGQVLGRRPQHLAPRDPCAPGAAQGYIEAAAALGLDAFISGEVSEQTWHVTQEAGIHYFAAGHHATERYGAEALGRHLAEQFGLDFEFVEIYNPV